MLYHDRSGSGCPREKYLIKVFRWNWFWKACLHESNLLLTSVGNSAYVRELEELELLCGCDYYI